MEVKYAEDGKLEAGCMAAMEQIEKMDYAQYLYSDGMKKIIKCGIACCRKDCKAVFEEV